MGSMPRVGGIDWQTSMMLRSPDIPVFLPLRAAAADPVADGVSSGYYCCNYYYCLRAAFSVFYYCYYY